jgi:perosamine synthetase
MSNFTNSVDGSSFIPYGQQWIDEEDIQAVVDVLRSDWLTTGPKVPEFEQAVADDVGAKYAVAVSSGTAALHAAMYAIGVGPGDEVILPPMTFVATANCIVFQGGTPVFSDVDPDKLLIDPALIEEKITSKTKAIIAVDYAGQPCDYDALRNIAGKHGIYLVTDACHTLGARYKDKMVGSLADMTVFSFHPVKHITTGEGGMIVTDNEELDVRLRSFRNHGIATDHKQREEQKTWFYEMLELGYNYRISDFQCALGLSQLKKLPSLLEKRRRIASHYDNAFASVSIIQPLTIQKHVLHAYHLYVIKLNLKALGFSRNNLFQKLRNKGIKANVHYIPVHLHPYYRKHFGTHSNLCPIAEKVYDQILSIPIYPGMTDKDIKKVINVIIGK